MAGSIKSNGNGLIKGAFFLFKQNHTVTIESITRWQHFPKRHRVRYEHGGNGVIEREFVHFKQNESNDGINRYFTTVQSYG